MIGMNDFEFLLDSVKTITKQNCTLCSIHSDLIKNGINLKNQLEAIEIQWIQQALEITKGNKNQAAKILGINRTTLIEKLKRVEDKKSRAN